MAMVVGSVEVDEEGGYTGTGLTKRFVDARLATTSMAALLAREDITAAQKEAIVSGMAADCAAMATAIVAEIVANAEVTVTVSASDAGLQRIPATISENEACKAPAAPVELSTKGTVA